MSRIEELKAEAVAFREAEKARGNILKHCDALEHIAKKHGFSNWRACLAALGAEDEPTKPTAVAPLAAAARFASSPLLGGEFESARQSAFTHWMTAKLRQAAVDFSRNIGLVPIYAETSPSGTRYLMWRLPAGAKCEVRSGRTKEQFLELDRVSRQEGRRLVSLHVSADSLYSSVWISAEHYPAAANHLKRFGISPPDIR